MKIYVVYSNDYIEDYYHTLNPVAFLDSMEKAEARAKFLVESHIIDSYIRDCIEDFSNQWLEFFGLDIDTVRFSVKLPDKPKFPQYMEQKEAQKIHLKNLEQWHKDTKNIQLLHRESESYKRGLYQFEIESKNCAEYIRYLKETLNFSDVPKAFINKFDPDSYNYKLPIYTISEEELE